jgi:hypothetical protein
MNKLKEQTKEPFTQNAYQSIVEAIYLFELALR